MSENKIIEIEQDYSKENLEINPTWTPLSNGEIFSNYIAAKANMSGEDRKSLESGSTTILGKCINPKNIAEVNLNSTGLCFGQIQSGKTTSMEAVFTLAADNNFKILILLTGSVGPLVVQNTGRIDNILESRRFEVLRNVGREWDHPRNLDILKSNLVDWSNPNIEEESKKTLVILSMKNPSRIRRLTKLFNEASNFDSSKYSKIPALIVDDECDHHSLNSKSSKNDPELIDDRELYEIKANDTIETLCERADIEDPNELFEINPGIDLKNKLEDYVGEKINLTFIGTATHFAIRNLRKLFQFHSFLGYTATPNANLLINTFNNLSPSFGEIIKTGKDYTGLEFFFSNQSKIDHYVKGIEENIREYEDQGSESPQSFRDAYMYFLTSVACALYQERDKINDPKQNMSMIIHPAGTTTTHRIYLNWIKGLQDKIRSSLTDKNSDEFKNLSQEITKHLNDIKKYSKTQIPEIDEKFLRHFQSADCLGRTPVPFNAAEGRRGIPSVDYRRHYANILVGGFGLDRGYTVEGLTVTYLCRSLGGRQEDTLLQRARFMGYQGKNSDFLRLWFTDEVLGFFEGEYDRNKNLMKFLERFLKSNQNLKTMRRFWFGRDRSQFKLTRSGVIGHELQSRPDPYPRSVRCRYSHLLDEKQLKNNRKIYSDLNIKLSNQFKQLNEINNIKENHIWTKEQNIKVLEKVPLPDVLELLSKFEYETRDMNRFSLLMNMIDLYLEPLQENLNNDEWILEKEKRKNTICPILIFGDNDGNTRSPYVRNRNKDPKPNLDQIKEGPVTSQTGQSSKFNDKNSNNIFPGDIRIHWDYLTGISNNEESLQTPTLQIHQLTISEELNGKGEIIAEEIPYLSFFMPRSMFRDSISAVQR